MIGPFRVPAGPAVVRPYRPVGAFYLCSVLCSLLTDRQTAGGGLSGSASSDPIGPGIRSQSG